MKARKQEIQAATKRAIREQENAARAYAHARTGNGTTHTQELAARAHEHVERARGYLAYLSQRTR